MKAAVIITRSPNTFPGFRGGPAPYAGHVLTIVWLGPSSRAEVTARIANDNNAGAVA